MATLPLNWDPLTDVILLLVNTSVFEGFLGALDAAGQAAATLDPGPLPAGYSGIKMHFSFALNSPFDLVSNPIEVETVQ
ncbi:MAG: hypothetical protein ACYTG7_13395 [Planctomycetota bacterium]|jgi:hypothetical protein